MPQIHVLAKKSFFITWERNVIIIKQVPGLAGKEYSQSCWQQTDLSDTVWREITEQMCRSSQPATGKETGRTGAGATNNIAIIDTKIK